MILLNKYSNYITYFVGECLQRTYKSGQHAGRQATAHRNCALKSSIADISPPTRAPSPTTHLLSWSREITVPTVHVYYPSVESRSNFDYLLKFTGFSCANIEKPPLTETKLGLISPFLHFLTIEASNANYIR